MPIRISAFFQHWPPYSGAAALRGQSILRGLRDLPCEQGKTLRVYTTTPNTTAVDGLTVIELPVAELENSEKLSRRILGELRIGWVASREILKRGDGCDLLIISIPAYLTGVVLSAMACLSKVPYALELRDVYPQVYAEAGLIRRSSFIYRFFSWLSRRAYERAECVVAATAGLARVVQEEAPAARVHCVYNGFPDEFLSRQADKRERFTVCFHGVLGFFQDVQTLISVAAELEGQGVDVLVIGYGRQEAELRKRVPGNLVFRGRLSFEQTIAEIETCHIGLCLRKDDGISRDAFPVKVWEYLGLGIPSIVTPNCEAGDFLEANRCGYQLQSGDVDDIVRTILELKNDREALARMAQNCLEIRQSYTRGRLGTEAAKLMLDSAARHPDAC